MTRFRFTLRELFLVIVIVALALAWSIDHLRLATALERTLIELDQERFRRYLDTRFNRQRIQRESTPRENPPGENPPQN